MSSLRPRVLRVYRDLIRCSKHWQAKDPSRTEDQKAYILSETRRLFRANSDLTDTETILKCVTEAEARMEIGIHYKDPYPRPVYFPPRSLTRTPQGMWGSSNIKRQNLARPVYLNTLDHEGKEGEGERLKKKGEEE